MAHPREPRFMPTVLGTEKGFPIGYPCQRHKIQEIFGDGTRHLEDRLLAPRDVTRSSASSVCSW